MHSVEVVLALVVLGTVVATVAERLRAPAPALLVLVGVAVGLLPGVPELRVDPAVISLVVLPPLLYAGATDVSLPDLRRVWRPVATLAVGLVAVTALAVALVLHAVRPEVSLGIGFVLGAVLASTDPVAVGALARRLQLPPRVLAVVQGESLLNDATSLVLFQVALLVAAGRAGSPLSVLSEFVRLGAGGAASGLVIALLVERLRTRSSDAVLQTVLALITPYATYVVAENLHTSGVTAVVVAGMRLASRGHRVPTAAARLQIDTVYSVVVFLLESVIFAVIGLQLPSLVRQLPPGDARVAPVAAAVIATVIVTRVLWVSPAVGLQRLVARRRDSRPPTWRTAAVVSWVGTRGVVPLAAALSIPLTSGTAPFPHRDLLLVLASACISTTLVVQGLTLAPLVARLGVVVDPDQAVAETTRVREATLAVARRRLDELADIDAVSETVLRRLRHELESPAVGTPALSARSGFGAQDAEDRAYRAVRRDLVARQSAALTALRDEGQIGEAVRRRAQRALDTEEVTLSSS